MPILAADDADGVLGGRPDREAAAEVVNALRSAGIDLKGIEVFVLPASGLNQSLLVAEIDQAKGATLPKDPMKMLSTLAGSSAVSKANITRVSFDFHGRDSKGAYVLTMSLPMGTVDALAKGSLSSADAQSQMLVQLTRGGQ
jgi:hypothetical protein